MCLPSSIGGFLAPGVSHIPSNVEHRRLRSIANLKKHVQIRAVTRRAITAPDKHVLHDWILDVLHQHGIAFQRSGCVLDLIDHRSKEALTTNVALDGHSRQCQRFAVNAIDEHARTDPHMKFVSPRLVEGCAIKQPGVREALADFVLETHNPFPLAIPNLGSAFDPETVEANGHFL
jgi:hypothetical protein